MSENYERIAGDFNCKDIVSMNQFDLSDIEELVVEAEDMAEMVKDQGRDDILSDLVIANTFFEASTRTFFSMDAAAKRLGATTIPMQGIEDYSSVSKGETFEDTIRTIARYSDNIVLRHPVEGSAGKAASVSDVPIINAGDGKGEHPTQALLDVFTIEDELEQVDGLTVTMVGDLKNGRTVHSLAKLLGKHSDMRINYVSPPELALPSSIIDENLGYGVSQFETTDLDEVIRDTDVLYVTRIQKERFESAEEYEKHKGAYVVDADVMKKLGRDAIVMHPLPRTDEINPEIDSDPRSAYFRQVENGMYMRMAIFALINGRSISD